MLHLWQDSPGAIPLLFHFMQGLFLFFSSFFFILDVIKRKSKWRICPLPPILNMYIHRWNTWCIKGKICRESYTDLRSRISRIPNSRDCGWRRRKARSPPIPSWRTLCSSRAPPAPPTTPPAIPLCLANPRRLRLRRWGGRRSLPVSSRALFSPWATEGRALLIGLLFPRSPSPPPNINHFQQRLL